MFYDEDSDIHTYYEPFKALKETVIKYEAEIVKEANTVNGLEYTYTGTQPFPGPILISIIVYANDIEEVEAGLKDAQIEIVDRCTEGPVLIVLLVGNTEKFHAHLNIIPVDEDTISRSIGIFPHFVIVFDVICELTAMHIGVGVGFRHITGFKLETQKCFYNLNPNFRMFRNLGFSREDSIAFSKSHECRRRIAQELPTTAEDFRHIIKEEEDATKRNFRP